MYVGIGSESKACRQRIKSDITFEFIGHKITEISDSNCNKSLYYLHKVQKLGRV